MHEIAIISPVNKCVYKNESNKQWNTTCG
jgi:hypothetical protein